MKYIQMSVYYTFEYYMCTYLFVALHFIINVQLLNTVEWITYTSYVYDATFKKLTITIIHTHTHTHTVWMISMYTWWVAIVNVKVQVLSLRLRCVATCLVCVLVVIIGYATILILCSIGITDLWTRTVNTSVVEGCSLAVKYYWLFNVNSEIT